MNAKSNDTYLPTNTYIYIYLVLPKSNLIYILKTLLRHRYCLMKQSTFNITKILNDTGLTLFWRALYITIDLPQLQQPYFPPTSSTTNKWTSQQTQKQLNTAMTIEKRERDEIASEHTSKPHSSAQTALYGFIHCWHTLDWVN